MNCVGTGGGLTLNLAPKPDGSLDIRSDAFKKSMAVFKQLYDKGLLYNVVGWSDYANAVINGGTNAGFVNGVWATGMVKSNPANKGKYIVLPTPPAPC